MSRKIIGVTVGTTISPKSIREKLNPVMSINGVSPDENGNIEVQGIITEADKAEIVEDVLASIPTPPQITINGKGPDENGNFVIDQVISDKTITPDKIIFPEGATTTYEVGKVRLENGMGTLVEPGGTLADFFDIFVDEKNPETTDPSVSLTFGQAKAYEVGTLVTPTYNAMLHPGSYSYGPATGVTATAWEVSDTAGHSSATASGSFNEFQVTDGMNYQIVATATYSIGSVPVTNTGNEYAAGQIPAGNKSATSNAVTGYRNTFYGTLIEKNDITSDTIRGLTTKSNKALTDGSGFTINVPIGALRVVFAYPATLRNVTSVKDINGMGADIASSFSKQIVDVEGANNYTAISYKVYTLDFANPNDTTNNFVVTI